MTKKPTRTDTYREQQHEAKPRMRPLVAAPEQAPPRDYSRARTLAAITACFAAVVVAAGFVLPAFGHGFQPIYVLGVAALIGAAYLLVRVGIRDDNIVRVTAVVAVCLSVFFVAGARDQVVINDVAYSSSSREARGHKLVTEVYSDLATMSSYDELLSLGNTDARARFSDYEPATADLTAIATKWSRRNLGDLPDPDFIDIVSNLKVSATFGAQAMNIRFNLLTEPDQRAEAALLENRSAFTSGVLQAGARLRPLADRYQVQLRPVTE